MTEHEPSPLDPAVEVEGDEPDLLPPPETVLAVIGDADQDLPVDDLRAISAPSEDVTRAYMAIWPALPVERRRELLAQFQRLAARDVTLDFDRQHLAALFDPDPATRILAIRGLHEHDREEYLTVLIDLLRLDAESSVQGEAAQALARFVVSMEFDLLTEPAADRLKDALRDTIEDVTIADDVRAHALEAIGAHSDEWVAELIVEMYESGSSPIRIATLRAMGRNAADSWLPILVHNFDDPDSDIRAVAAEASGQLLMEEAVPPLALLVRDDEAEVRRAAVFALGEIQGDAAQAVLDDLAKSNDPDLAALAGEVLRDVQVLSIDHSGDLAEPTDGSISEDD